MSEFGGVRFMGEGYRAAARRTKWMRTEWRGFPVQSDSYTIVDASLPPALADLLQKTVTREQFSAISQWLGESPAPLCDYGSVTLPYIPQWGSGVHSEHLPKKEHWVVPLNNPSSHYSQLGTRPFLPYNL